jgi:organic hydroperoxide reductase OsmC/OhrA
MFREGFTGGTLACRPMSSRIHEYDVEVRWTGNLGEGTAGYRAYSRDHEAAAEGRPPIPGSSEPGFRGDPGRWNPEQLLVASLSQCHLLWYLHLCASEGVVVTGYEDHAHGVMEMAEDGGGEFTEVLLRPAVTVAEDSMIARAAELHERAHELCFIARSVSFPVHHEPEITAA